MNLRQVKVIFSMAAAMIAIPAVGQDLLADQAPIDKRMRAVDSVSLKSLIKSELFIEDNTDFSSDWGVHDEGGYSNFMQLSEKVVDLRNFAMPTTRRVITSRFGPRWGRAHKGIDIKVYVGDTIASAFDGRIKTVKNEPRGYGKYIVVRHNNGLETLYAHLSGYLVNEGDMVRAGEPIGLGGNTGRSTGSHLHFETRLFGVAINPAHMFDFENQDIVSDHYVFRRDAYEKENARAHASSRSSSKSAKYHKVKKGDTAGKIAKKYGISINKLYQLNKISAKTILKPGQLLRCT